MQNLLDSLIDDQDDSGNDFYLEILNDTHGHFDLNEISKYHDMTSYDNLSSNPANQLNLLHINARSLPDKSNQISAMLSSLKRSPDILCFSESWLQESSHESCNFSGFKGYHVYRKQRCHGGVSIFVSNYLSSTILPDSSYIHDDIEIISVEVQISDKSFIICTIYRPHSQQERVDRFSDKLSQILHSMIFGTRYLREIMKN